MGKVLKSPLLWFILMGLVLFMLDGARNSKPAQTILVTQGDVQRIHDQWQAQSGNPVSGAMFNALLQEQIQERRLYREALELGLDEDDVIVRRRLAQKLRFLSEDLVNNRIIDDGELENYYAENSEVYFKPAEISFRHIYFSADKPVKKVHETLAMLRSQDDSHLPTELWRNAGDPFMLGRSFRNQSLRQITQQFGAEFADALSRLTLHSWQGPLSSAFGLHLVLLEHYQAATPLPFVEVQDQVQLDYRAARRKESFSNYLDKLAIKYPVIMEAVIETGQNTETPGKISQP